MIFRLFDGKLIVMNFEADEPIINVYIKISEKIGTSIDFLRLIHRGSQLECGKRLSDYNVNQDDTINLLGKLLGGEMHQKKCMWL